MKLWGRAKDTNQYKFICDFYDDRQFYFMCDSLDKTKYSEVMITDDSGTRCLFYYEFKDFTPYFKKYKIKKRN